MAHKIDLGYSGDSLWIRFSEGAAQFPSDTLISPCALYYLQTNGWAYLHGNGCGTGVGNRTFLRIVNAIFQIDFTPVCHIHDLCYSLDAVEYEGDTCVKTYRHKMYSDMAFEYNLNAYAMFHSKGKPRRGIRMLAFVYMLAVRLFGQSSYWGTIPKKNRV